MLSSTRKLFFALAALAVLVGLTFSVSPSGVKATGVYNASDLLGQFGLDKNISYTNNTLNNYLGVDRLYRPQDVAVDTTHHRLFAVEPRNNRVIVYDLDTNNEIINRYSDYILGQSSIFGVASGTGMNGMNNPQAVVYDANNSRLFVSDKGNARVLVFDLSTSISTGMSASNFLGSGSSVAAQDSTPSAAGLAYDTTNDILYVADEVTSRVLAFDVNTTATPKTFCGEATTGIVDGMNASCVIGEADFVTANQGGTTTGAVSSLAFDQATFRLFAGTTGTSCGLVKVFDMNALANDMPSINILGQDPVSCSITQNRFSSTVSISYDSTDDILVLSDRSNARVLLFDVNTTTTPKTFCGEATTGIVDGMNASCVLGQSTFTTGTQPSLSQHSIQVPYGSWYDSTDSLLYLADGGSVASRIMVFDLSTISNNQDAVDMLGHVDGAGNPAYTDQVGYTFFTGTYATVPSGLVITARDDAFNTPSSILVDTAHHRLFTADSANNRVLVFNLDSSNNLVDHVADNVLGQSLTIILNGPGVTASRLNTPLYLAYDSTGDRLFVSDSANNRVVVYDTAAITNGEVAVKVLGQSGFTTATDFGADQSHFQNPQGLAYDSTTGLLYVSDITNSRVLVFDARSSGSAQTLCAETTSGLADGMNASCVIGQADFSGTSGDTQQNALNLPRGLAIDETDHRLFVADANNNRVLSYDTTALATTMNASNVIGAADFITAGAVLSHPTGLAYDSVWKQLFVSDKSNNRIFVYDVVPGTFVDGPTPRNVLGQSNFTDVGSATTQSDFDSPMGIAFDASTNHLYTADTNNNRIIIFNFIVFHPSTQTSFSGTVGTPFAQNFSTVGQQGTVTYEVTSGSLPAGISISVNGFSGTPSVAGTYNFTLRTVDTVSTGTFYSDAKSMTVTIGASSGSGGGTGVVIIPPSTTSGTTGSGTTGVTTTGTTTTGTTTGSTSSTTSGTTGTGVGGDTGSGSIGSGSTTSGGSGSITGADTGGTSFGGDSGTGFSGSSGSTTFGTTGGAASGATGGTTGGTTSGTGGGCATETNVLGVAVCIVVDSYHTTVDTLGGAIFESHQLLETPNGDFLTKLIGIVGLIFAAIFTLLPVLFSNPLSFSELIFMPYRLWSLLLVAFGLKKRTRPWGTVYDAVTKQPLDPAVVTLYDLEGKEIATSITDLDGRYGFLVGPGQYRIVAAKTHYAFPSLKLVGKTRDEIYLDLYFGTMIEIKEEGEVITKNIPMDPENFDWNEFAKRDQKLMTFYSKRDFFLARVSDIMFSFGFGVSLIAVISSPKTYNIVVFALYILLFIFKEIGLKTRKSGRVLKTGTEAPLSYGVLRIYTAKSMTQVATRIADKIGIYYCLIANGEYVVTIEQKNLDESYTKVYTSEPFNVKKGFINKTFKV